MLPKRKRRKKNHLIEETYVRELKLWWSAWGQTYQATERGTSNPVENKERGNIEKVTHKS